MRVVILILFSFFFTSCNKNPCNKAVESSNIELKTERLEKELFASQSSKDVEQFLKKHTHFAQFFLHANQYPSDTILAKRMYGLLQHPSIDTLYQEAVRTFSNFDKFLTTLKNGLSRLKNYYPQQAPESLIIQTAVTGLYNDLYISNERIIIGMDFFIGENASYQPPQIPHYLWRRYTLKHLPANILQFISSQFIVTGGKDDMLTEMIDYGKSYYLLSQLLPCTPANILIGYTDEEWNDIIENENIIWANFVENKLIYETNHETKQKFLGERPNVYEIGDKCPGRIGRWLGWQIVQKYAKNTEKTVQQILAETDISKIFRLSKYKPS